MGAVAAETLGSRIAQRDRYLDELGAVPPIPRCHRCGLELIPPFREPGVHPECAGA